jgi:hypothetical protein
VKIRMCQIENVSARRACSAWRARISAQEALGEPDREALFADPARALEEKARGKSSSAHARGEALPEQFVSEYVDDWHKSNMVSQFGYRGPGTWYRVTGNG